MTLDEAKYASNAYYRCSNILNAIERLRAHADSETIVEVGLGKGYTPPWPHVLVNIPRDLVDRMLEHALARAKDQIAAIHTGDSP